MNGRIQKGILAAVSLFLLAESLAPAQQTNANQNLPSAPISTDLSFQRLNYLDGDASMPTFSDSVIGVQSKFRRSLFRRGTALRVISEIQYAQNALDAPVPADAQVYEGQRPYEGADAVPIFTADLRQFHLHQSQLFLGGVWNWVSWNPAGPKAFQFWNLYFYKGFGENRVALKAGYISNFLEFIGLFVGGSISTGTQGAYFILPYEVGMSYFPLTAPSVDVRVQARRNLYFKTAAQRSLDPHGGPAEVKRNHTGFRFIPHGDNLLSINEAGFLHRAQAGTRETWLRAGYMRNFTAYNNAITGRNDSGNYCAYALIDYQITQSNLDNPNHGVYLGTSVEAIPEALNPYARYFEVRLYKNAPFRSRSDDIADLVLSRTGYSKYFTRNLAAEGKTVSHGLTDLTGSYTLHVSPGNYAGISLSYMNGPAISPRTPNALIFAANWTVFF